MGTSSGKPEREEKADKDKTFRAFCEELLALDMAFEAARVGDGGLEMAMDAEELKNRILRDLDLPKKTTTTAPA